MWEGDLEHVKQLLRLGANVECVNECKNTPLHLAVEQIDLSMARLLLDAGARVDGRTADGYWTPLPCDRQRLRRGKSVGRTAG